MTETVTIEVPKGAEIKINGEVYKPEPRLGFDGLATSQDARVYALGDVGGLFSRYKHQVAARIKRGLVYPSHEAAMLADRRRILTHEYLCRIAELNHEQGWVCSWNNVLQYKYSLFLDVQAEKFEFYAADSCQHKPSLHYGSQKTMETVLKEFTQDELKLIIAGE